MAFKDDISMQEYYGSFPTTSKATAVSRKAGVRKISVSPVLNAGGPTGEERYGESMDRIPSPANPNRGPENIGPRNPIPSPANPSKGPQVSATTQEGSGASSSEGSGSIDKAVKSNANLYFFGGGLLLLAILVYKKLKK